MSHEYSEDQLIQKSAIVGKGTRLAVGVCLR